jgi:flagellar basal body-associated protein FliL
MSKFCPNCGDEISDKVNFCQKCGADIDSFSVKKNEKSTIEETKKDIKIEDTKIENKKIERKYTFTDLLVYGVIIVVAIIIFMVGMAFIAGMSGNIHSSNAQSSNPPQAPSANFFVPTTESQTGRNVRIANEIVANYHKTHTYSLNDFYICADMASDVWDMLKTQGINAKIQI